MPKNKMTPDQWREIARDASTNPEIFAKRVWNALPADKPPTPLNVALAINYAASFLATQDQSTESDEYGDIYGE